MGAFRSMPASLSSTEPRPARRRQCPALLATAVDVSASVDPAAALPISRFVPSLTAAPQARRTGFISMAGAHLLFGNRLVSRELASARRRAVEIPDPDIRAAALRALAKGATVGGAPLLPAFGPRPHRSTALRAVIAFQIAYTHLDATAEIDSDEP